jgi:hypothetical protein
MCPPSPRPRPPTDAPRPGRQAWTDERLDEFAQRTNEDIKEIQAGIDRRLNILLTAVAMGFASLVTVVATHFLG